MKASQFINRKEKNFYIRFINDIIDIYGDFSILSFNGCVRKVFTSQGIEILPFYKDIELDKSFIEYDNLTEEELFSIYKEISFD